MGFFSYSGPPSCGNPCSSCDCPPCDCSTGIPTDTAANVASVDTGAAGGVGGGTDAAPLGQGTPKCANPGTQIGTAGTTTTRIHIKGAPDNYSHYSAESKCLSFPLKNGRMLRLAWTQLSGKDLGYGDNFWPAGDGAVWSFYPSLAALWFDGNQWSERSSAGTGVFAGEQYGTDIPRTSFSSATYFSTYDARSGTYFEYFRGANESAPESGRLNRQYDFHGSELKYDNRYVALGGVDTLMPFAIGGSLVGRVVPYFEYTGDTGFVQRYHIGKVYLLDLDSPSSSRTIYFDYSDPISPVVSKVVYPNGCTTLYAAEGGNGERQYIDRISCEVDAEGYTTYFEFEDTQVSGNPAIKKTIEPEGRVTYYEYMGSGVTQKALLGRGTTYFNYVIGADENESALPTRQVDPVGNVTQWGYGALLNQAVRRVNPNGDVTYFEYVGGSAANVLGIARVLRVTSGAETYFGYNGTTYDLAKVVGPRHTSSFNVTTYHQYNSTRNRVTTVDALGNKTRWGYDALGRKSRIQDARSNTTYFNYGDATGHLDSEVRADGSIAYFGYNSFRNKLREVSPRWTEQSFSAFTTYYEYDSLSRKTKSIDPQGNVSYFDWTNRSDLLDQVDARGTTTAFTYNGLRLMNQRTVTDSSGTQLTQVKHGYDIYKNRIRTRDGRGNTTYFFYDQLDRQTAQVDALLNGTYYFYDSMGSRTHVRDSRGNTTYYFFNGLTRNTAIRDALGDFTYYFYDLANNQSAQVDALRFPTYFFYDALDRRQATRDALGNPTYFFYDTVGSQTAVTDARSNSSYFSYDQIKRNVAVRDALGNQTYFGYDAAGNKTRVKDARNNTTYFTFDTLGRIDRQVDALSNPSYFGYDAVGNRVRVMNPRFISTYFFYDGLRRRTGMADSLGGTAYLFYDQTGNRTALQDARSNTTYYFYDAINRVSVVRDALGNTTYFGYDAVSNLVRSVDARLNITYFTFDNLNRQTSTIDPVGNAVLSGYDAAGNLSALNRGAGGADASATTYFFYDGLRRTEGQLDPLGSPAYFWYDQVGNQTKLLNPQLHATYFGYDSLNRLSQIQDALGANTYYEYDSVGNSTKVVDADNHAGMNRYDSLNRLDAVRFADAGATYFFYDQTSSRTNVVDPLGKSTYFGYDSLDRLNRIQDALGQTLYYEYDAVGNRARFQDAEGASCSYTYDAVNRRTNSAFTAAGSVVAASLRSDPYFVYDEVSNLVQMGDLWGLHLFGYDAANRLLRHQFGNGSKVYFEYDRRDNVTARVYPGVAGRSGAAYDLADRQTRIQAPSGATAYFTYDAASNLTQRFLGDGAKIDISYDNAERIQSWRGSNKNGLALTYFDYTRDSKGLPTKMVREATHAVYYRYDERDRLVAEIWATTGASPSEVYGYRYSYDVAGNRLKARMNGSDTYYFYDQASQLTISGTSSGFANPTYYAYDKNGSLTDLIEPGGITKFAYNAAGLVARLKWADASATYFFYDGMLQRYAMNAAGTVTYFLWDDLDLLQELNSDGTVKEEHTNARTSISGIGQLVETYRPSEGVQKIYPMMDARGTITKWVQSDGTTILASREYDAFGQIIPNSATGTWPSRHGYQGQAWQEILSSNGSQRLMLSPTRLYNPLIGLFMSKDPLATGDPAEMGMRSHTQKELDPDYIAFNSNNSRHHFPKRTMSPFRGSFIQLDPLSYVLKMLPVANAFLKYAYVSGNPLKAVDTLGLWGKIAFENCPDPICPDGIIQQDFARLMNENCDRAQKLLKFLEDHTRLSMTGDYPREFIDTDKLQADLDKLKVSRTTQVNIANGLPKLKDMLKRALEKCNDGFNIVCEPCCDSQAEKDAYVPYVSFGDILGTLYGDLHICLNSICEMGYEDIADTLAHELAHYAGASPGHEERNARNAFRFPTVIREVGDSMP